MATDAERRTEEQMIAGCASHAWNVSDRSDFERNGIRTEAQLKDKIRDVINDPRTRAFACQPKMDLAHPRGGDQLPREVYLLKEGSRTTVVVLNHNRVAGSAWIGSGNQEKRMVKREMDKNNLLHEPEIVIGGRPALLEREKHRQVLIIEQSHQAPPLFSREHARETVTPARAEQQRHDDRKESLLERLQREKPNLVQELQRNREQNRDHERDR